MKLEAIRATYLHLSHKYAHYNNLSLEVIGLCIEDYSREYYSKVSTSDLIRTKTRADIRTRVDNQISYFTNLAKSSEETFEDVLELLQDLREVVASTVTSH